MKKRSNYRLRARAALDNLRRNPESWGLPLPSVVKVKKNQVGVWVKLPKKSSERGLGE
jgi:hypothetical protein